MRFLLIVFFLVCSTSVQALTLSEAISISFEKSSALKQQDLELKKAELSVTQSRAAFFPSLDLTASYLYSEENPEQRPYNWDSAAGIQLSQNFYDHGASFNSYRISQKRRDLTLLEYRREKSTTILRVVQLYFEILKAQKTEELQKKNTQQVERIYRLIESQYRQGIRQRQDFLRFEAQLQRAKLSQSSASFEVIRVIEDLKVYLGLTELQGPFLDYSKTAFKTSSELAVYEKEKSRLTSELRSYEEKTADLESRPKIDLVGRWGYGSSGYFRTDNRWNDNDQTSWSVGLTFNWNLWDWGQRRSAQDIAGLETLRQEVRSRFDEQAALSEVIKLSSRVDLLQEQFTVATTLDRLEAESNRFLEQGFREGRTSFLDYASSLSNVVSAQIQRVQAEYNLMQVKFELEHRQGYLDENSIR